MAVVGGFALGVVVGEFLGRASGGMLTGDAGACVADRRTAGF